MVDGSGEWRKRRDTCSGRVRRRCRSKPPGPEACSGGLWELGRNGGTIRAGEVRCCEGGGKDYGDSALILAGRNLNWRQRSQTKAVEYGYYFR